MSTHKPDSPAQQDRSGRPATAHETEAEQLREAQEQAKARNAEASNRERMVEIGRGNQQAGRQGQ